jgi:hypothetical protein
MKENYLLCKNGLNLSKEGIGSVLKEPLQRFEEFGVVIKVVPMVLHPIQKSGSDSVCLV